MLAAVAPLAFAASNASAAAPKRTATTTDYTTARFLQDTLGLPSAADHAIEPVTYDHLQWLLQQAGEFALLIGDPALDASFAARAQDVEAAAKAAGVERVYWFDPNLSGSVRVGNITEPNLDIRNPAGITSLPTASQDIYGNAWLNLVGQYLGNGVSIAVTCGTVGDEDDRHQRHDESQRGQRLRLRRHQHEGRRSRRRRAVRLHARRTPTRMRPTATSSSTTRTRRSPATPRESSRGRT